MSFYTYLLASAPYGTLYCGHTDNLVARVWKHREKIFPGFTAKYGLGRLVWYEAHGERTMAFRRERQIKKWNRAWKIRLIEAENPSWADLYQDLVGWADPEGELFGLEFTPPASPPPLIPAEVGIQADAAAVRPSAVEAGNPLGSPPSRGRAE